MKNIIRFLLAVMPTMSALASCPAELKVLDQQVVAPGSKLAETIAPRGYELSDRPRYRISVRNTGQGQTWFGGPLRSRICAVVEDLGTGESSLPTCRLGSQEGIAPLFSKQYYPQVNQWDSRTQRAIKQVLARLPICAGDQD